MVGFGYRYLVGHFGDCDVHDVEKGRITSMSELADRLEAALKAYRADLIVTDDRLESWRKLFEVLEATTQAAAALRDMGQDAQAYEKQIEGLHRDLDEARITLRAMAWVDLNDNSLAYPEEGRWVLVENVDSASTWYRARKHDRRSWPIYGVRWRYIVISMRRV